MPKPVKQWIVDEYAAIVGRHDNPRLFGGPAGDPGLLGPDSISWRIHADVSSVAIAGAGAITMEILHPSVMAGVHDMSSYREDPFRRARTTAGYVITTTFGSTQAATNMINAVRGIHGKINGTRPDGIPFRALDPKLIGWVHTCIPWGIMLAYDRYCRPLSVAERDQYLAEQAIIGRLGGAEDIPETYAELLDYVEAMRPNLAVNEQTRTFFEFMLTAPFGPSLPDPVADRIKLLSVHASMSLQPDWARDLTGFHHGELVQRAVVEPYLQLIARGLRWGCGTPPYKAMAEARMRGSAPMTPKVASQPVAA
ncbi:MAG: DUF2236 domain-containing protein [Solirubrobacteraceae bacterium]|nr:DUF2236 domain-containing protein [Solirubrobacteraceae bacterium]